MGFWHTGYIEFHEHVGWDDLLFPKEPQPTEYLCPHCDMVFLDPTELRQHRFESHPVFRPTLLIGGEELGNVTFHITKSITPDDVAVRKALTARINGKNVPIEELGAVISEVESDLIGIVLENDDSKAEFTIDIQVASEGDVIGVESAFKELVLGERLDLRTIESFISSVSRFRTASRFADGICEYLFGVLAKEQSADTELERDQYVHKFNRATDLLAGFDRPVSRTIRALVAFNFNHFGSAARLAPSSRVGVAAARLDDALNKGVLAPRIMPLSGPEVSVDRLISDWETERQIVWATKNAQQLASEADELEKILISEIGDLDSLKMRLLLAHVYRQAGEFKTARDHARMLRNSPTVGDWAESFIRSLEK